ncbi:ORF V: Enzymatic polyprotein [Labeo rohita]|uniref:ORF V: Enzymatic polyprotein n=1 Tax=Labeo rohita TaxID=84645 RepID=A0ABQ8LP63_LABRO|nr:ORF V: Enzymatic polyprotein [Labeo rohita]
MSIAASEEDVPLAEADDSAGQSSAERAAQSEVDAELAAMLLRAAKSIELEVHKAPSPERLRLDDWFLGVKSDVPPRPEIHEELTKTWAAPFTARPRQSSSLPSMGGQPGGRHLEEWSAPPIQSLKAFVGSGCEGLWCCGSGCLRFACDGHPVTVRALGQVMFTMVVQERHLWLNMAQMSDVDKARFLNAPVSQVGLFGDTVEDFAQQFSAVQKQTEAINTSCPTVTKRWVLDLRLLVAEGAPLRHPHLLRPPHHRKEQPLSRGIEPAAGRRRSSLLRRPLKGRPARLRSDPDTGSLEMEEIVLRVVPTSLPPPRGRAGGWFPASTSTGGLASAPQAFSLADPELASSTESVPSQATVQDAHPQTHSFMCASPGLVCNHRPEERILSCLDLALTQTVSLVCLRGSGISVQSPPLWPVPVPPSIYQTRHPQLSRRLADNSSHSRSVVSAQDLCCAPAPQPLGAAGQLGEEQALPCTEHLFARYGVRFGQHDTTSHERARAVNAELSETFQTQDSGPSQILPEAAGAYGSRCNATQPAPYETASALATRLDPEMGMAPQYLPGRCYPRMPPSRQPVCNRQAASGSWTGPRLRWHVNCLELLAVFLALRRFLPMLRHKHVLVRMDNTATVAYINHQGGLRSRRMSQLVRHLLLWSQTQLKSLRAVHIPGELNRAADALS